MNIPQYSYITQFNIFNHSIKYTQINTNTNTNKITTHIAPYNSKNTDLFHYTHNFIHYNTNTNESYNVFKHSWKDNCTFDPHYINIDEQHQDYNYNIDDEHEDPYSDYSTDEESDFEYV